MSGPPVTASALRRAADRLGIDIDETKARDYVGGADELVTLVRTLDRLPDHVPRVTVARTPGYRPDAEEDPLNAWYRRTDIVGSPTGPLAGKTVALKDTVCLAGVPMMNGASYLEGYVPEIDATIVTRLLDAGARITGKTNCEYLCFSGDSTTNDTGPTHNPHRHGWSAGGSSSGSAAAVAAGEVDIAIGGDQGGSIRIPAAFCGVYGMKPTWGLVPYTGVFSTERTLDHVGPLTTTLHDNATTLQVLAGADGLDPRQGVIEVQDYAAGLADPIDGLQIGLLGEALAVPGGDGRVDQVVRDALARLGSAGATVVDCSVPFHRQARALWAAIVLQGGLEMLVGDAAGTNAKGLYVDSMARRQHAWRTNPDELPDAVVVSVLAGEILRGSYGGRYYRKAQNLSRLLASAYDAALERVDVLAMPTVPFSAPRMADDDMAPAGARLQTAQTTNTAPMNCTGHPALSVPCGTIDGLPVGMMLVGRHFDERTLYRAASGYANLAGGTPS